MTRNAALLFGSALILTSAGLSIWAYPHAPPIVPTHWDAAGHVNGYMSKLWGIWLWPIILLGIWLLIIILPAISPKGFRLEQSANVLNLIVVAVMVTEFIASVVVIRSALGMPAPPSGFMLVLVGVLFLIIGNFMGKMRKNFFMGIRTPWTLASDEVWLRTHRLSGWLFMLGGITFLVCGLAGVGSAAPIMAVVVGLVIVPIVYSYVIYRRIEGFGPNGS